jgi:hypothetical protein
MFDKIREGVSQLLDSEAWRDANADKQAPTPVMIGWEGDHSYYVPPRNVYSGATTGFLFAAALVWAVWMFAVYDLKWQALLVAELAVALAITTTLSAERIRTRAVGWLLAAYRLPSRQKPLLSLALVGFGFSIFATCSSPVLVFEKGTGEPIEYSIEGREASVKKIEPPSTQVLWFDSPPFSRPLYLQVGQGEGTGSCEPILKLRNPIDLLQTFRYIFIRGDASYYNAAVGDNQVTVEVNDADTHEVLFPTANYDGHSLLYTAYSRARALNTWRARADSQPETVVFVKGTCRTVSLEIVVRIVIDGTLSQTLSKISLKERDPHLRARNSSK